MSTKRKALTKLATPVVKSSAKLPTKSTIDESRTSVAGTDVLPSSQAPTIDISSDNDSDEDFSDEDEDDAQVAQVNGDKSHKNQVNGDTSKQQQPVEDSPNDETDGADGDEATSPSFGELLRSNDAVDVQALLHQPSTSNRALQTTSTAPLSLHSLTTVLSQALRTDDVDLLESCLHTAEPETIRNTIENIDSTLAATLLTKLAARLHRRPGRAGSLTQWVKWTLIAHGGALASQPQIVQSLGGLQKVLSERSKGLNSLLALKGKLDLLEGQMELRRKQQKRYRGTRHNGDDEDDEDVIWVEGETERVNGKISAAQRNRRAENGDSEEEEEDGFAVNGTVGDSTDEDDSEDEEDESENGEDERLDEDEVDHEDVDESMGEDEDSDVEAAPPSKLQKVAGSFSKRK